MQLLSAILTRGPIYTFGKITFPFPIVADLLIIALDDIIFGKTIIDKSSLDIISGSVVDFKKEMIGESFVIDNPKATASCGCGLSFSV